MKMFAVAGYHAVACDTFIYFLFFIFFLFYFYLFINFIYLNIYFIFIYLFIIYFDWWGPLIVGSENANETVIKDIPEEENDKDRISVPYSLMLLNLKAPNKNCSRRHFNFLLLSFEENNA